LLTFVKPSNSPNLQDHTTETVGIRRQSKRDNRATQRSWPDAGFDFAGIGIQPKLQVSQPGDPYEQEADLVAEQIMNKPHTDNAIQRKCITCKEVHRKINGGSDVQTGVAEEIKNLRGGTPLDSSAREFMESRFGHDFGTVRVHTGADASASAESLGALAYTVGKQIVFRQGMYMPQTHAGQKLIAHELAHVVQQASIHAGAPAGMIQRQEANDSDEKKNDAGEVVAEGLKTVAEQAKDNNPQVKKKIIEPLEKWGKSKWESLSTGEKATGISFGVATIGLSAGSLLADPKGRKLLEGVDLGAPLKLVPYVPLTGFTYTLPSGKEGENRLFRFETTFSGDDYLKLLTERKDIPGMSLQVKMQWGYDPEARHLGVLGAQAQVGLAPGLSISAGTYPDILGMPETFMTSEGQMVTSKQRIPDAGHEKIPDARLMLNIDLLKLDKRIVGKKLHGILMSF
jgi:hypothetical protein